MYSTIIFNYKDQENFKEYLHFKKRIFVDEGNWNLPLDKSEKEVLPDEFDADSSFILLRENDENIGVARFTILINAFPYKSILLKYFNIINKYIDECEIATINSFAILTTYRRSGAEENKKKMIASEYLWKQIKCELISNNIKLVLITTDEGRGEHFFSRIGFNKLGEASLLFDTKTKYINMGIVLSDEYKELSFLFK